MVVLLTKGDVSSAVSSGFWGGLGNIFSDWTVGLKGIFGKIQILVGGLLYMLIQMARFP